MTQITSEITPVIFENNQLVLLDQRKLPHEEVYLRYSDAPAVADAIQTMVVRGAPAIGVTAAFGIVLAAINARGDRQKIMRDCDILAASRPTAVNLFWAIDRMKHFIELHGTDANALRQEAQRILTEDLAACKEMGRLGADYFEDGFTVLTHCNAGALATAGWGTALGVIRSAVDSGKKITVYSDETRPRLQGAHLTAWELHKDGIECYTIADGAAAHFISRGNIDAVIVGSDRIAANGDVCNKIGTCGVAYAAHACNVPFYVAAPTSTIDMETSTGEAIEIEERDQDEVKFINDKIINPKDVPAKNPAFDVTPSNMVTAIFTEKGVVKPPYTTNLKSLF